MTKDVLLLQQGEIFIAAERQSGFGNFGVSLEFRIGPDPVAQVECLAANVPDP